MVKPDIFGMRDPNPPFRFVEITTEGFIKIEQIPEHWVETKQTNDYIYYECVSGGAGNRTFYHREDKKGQLK